jgi:hypothetical protein
MIDDVAPHLDLEKVGFIGADSVDTGENGEGHKKALHGDFLSRSASVGILPGSRATRKGGKLGN